MLGQEPRLTEAPGGSRPSEGPGDLRADPGSFSGLSGAFRDAPSASNAPERSSLLSRERCGGVPETSRGVPGRPGRAGVSRGVPGRAGLSRDTDF